MENLYETLEINSGAKQVDIKKAFQKLALIYHPDKNNNLDSNKTFEQISKAYQTLKDPAARSEYDSLYHYRCTLLKSMGPLFEKVTIAELNYDPISSDYSYTCRCADEIYISEKEVSLKLDAVQCLSCSLCLVIDYHSNS